MDRINVRRLLLRARKLISAVAVRLLFEQNDDQVRQEFLRLVNPILESIKDAGALAKYEVVMDDTNNTPSIIDRNQLVGSIYLQPTKTAEFILLNFNILPTGATFGS